MRRTIEICRRLDEVCRNNGEIYIRCAGNVGQQLYYEMNEIGIQVKAFLDSNPHIDIEGLEIPVESPEVIYGKTSGKYFVMIAVKDDTVYEEICGEFQEHGMRMGIDFGDFSFDSDRRMQNFMDIKPRFDFKRKFKEIAYERMLDMKTIDPGFDITMPDAYNLIPNLDVPLTSFCSMSCEYCSHCIPYANPKKHFEPDKIIHSLNKLLEVSFIACLGIMGGEPFVYPKITEFINKFANLKKLHNIGFTRIVTNGTLLPDEDFFIAYKKIQNAYIYISNYGEKSTRINELLEVCNLHGIKTYVCPISDEWLLLGEIFPRRNYSVKQLRHLYAVCGSHSCIQLINGRVYSCGRVPILNEDKIIPFCDTDYCEVTGEYDVTLSERLHQYLYEKPYLEGCQYCDGQHIFSKRVSRGN